MDNIVHRYLEDPKHKEFEIRYTFPNDNIEFWLERFNVHLGRRDAKIEQTLVIIKNMGRAQRRLEIAFKDGKKIGETYLQKTRIMDFSREINTVQVKCSLSEELPINTIISSNDAQLARLRLRCSFFDSQWRTDFTLVRTVHTANFNKIPDYKQEMFPQNVAAPDPKDFTKVVMDLIGKNKDAYTWELETEYIGRPATISVNTIDAFIHGFLQLMSPKLATTSMIFSLMKLFPARKGIPAQSLKQFTNQPIAFDENTYARVILPNLRNYYLTDKADGEHALLMLSGGENGSDNKLILANEVRSLDVTMSRRGDASLLTVLDCEYMPATEKIYAFDLLYKGVDCTQQGFNDRYKTLITTLTASSSAMTTIGVERKLQVRLDESPTEAAHQISEMYKRATRLYSIDGLIFTPAAGNYFDMKVYKWKPPERETIDFLVYKIPNHLVSAHWDAWGNDHKRTGRDLYALFCSISSRMAAENNLIEIPDYEAILGALAKKRRLATLYYPIQFSTPDYPHAYLYATDTGREDEISGHVGEFLYDVKTNEWTLTKLRPDKDKDVTDMTAFGNDYRTAFNLFGNYFKPAFTLERLLELTSKGASNEAIANASTDMTNSTCSDSNNNNSKYFSTDKDDSYKALTKYNAFVKAQLIRQLEGSLLIVDLAAGKGQDLFTYSGFGIKRIVMIDKDRDAVTQAADRGRKLRQHEWYVYSNPPKVIPTLYTACADVTSDLSGIIVDTGEKLATVIYGSSKRPASIASGVIINFALHYILADMPLLKFIHLIQKMVAPGGIFIFTCFNGQRVFDLLENTAKGESWDVHEGGSLKYSIRKLYNSSKFVKDNKQMIGVLHPFSAGEYYEEPLVDINYITDMFVSSGFQLRQTGRFLDWMSKYKMGYSKWADKLTDADKQYSGLYSYVSLYKPK